MNCPTCKKHDDFVFEENIRVWRCDRCHERFIIKPRRTNCDASEEFIRVATTNGDRIRSAPDEQIAKELIAMYLHGHCDANEENGFCISEQSLCNWLQQPAKEDK